MDYGMEYADLRGKRHIFKKVDYDELMNLLSSLYTGFVYIGGPWCAACQAVMGLVNDIAIKEGLECVYNYDTQFINVFNEIDDIRNCADLDMKMKYYDLVKKIGFKSKETVKDTLISKIHVPFFIAIKNGTCVGYYSIELLRDENGLHEVGKTHDMTDRFTRHIRSLIRKIKIKKKDNPFKI